MGLPGLRGVDHFGFTVPDLEQARTFLVEVLGCEYLFSLGPFDRDGEWMQEHLNVEPSTRMELLHFFACGGKTVFEVFQYSAAERTRHPTAELRRGWSPRVALRQGPRCGRGVPARLRSEGAGRTDGERGRQRRVSDGSTS